MPHRGQGKELEVEFSQFLSRIVLAKNEIDFIGIFNVKPLDPRNPFLVQNDLENAGREVDPEKLIDIVSAKTILWDKSPGSGFEMRPGERDIQALVPCWDPRKSSEDQSTYGYYILFVSATSAGENIFRNAITHHVEKIIIRLKQYLVQIEGSG